MSDSIRVVCVFFLMIRRPPRSTQSRSSAASDVYKRQTLVGRSALDQVERVGVYTTLLADGSLFYYLTVVPVSYTHLRAHETVLDLVCRLLLEKKNKDTK